MTITRRQVEISYRVIIAVWATWWLLSQGPWGLVVVLVALLIGWFWR